jgi:endonuclease/exonuclease/phosphatase family metal-dependent hydrolase
MKRRVAAVVAVTAVFVAVSATPSSAALSPRMTVMTQNLYLGTDLVPIATAPDLPTFQQRAAQGFRNVRATNFPARAKALARIIDRTDPDLVGLQEVTTWYRSPNGVNDGYATRSRIVVYDFLRTLLSELRKRGARYRAVASDGLPTDVEGPTALGHDVRFRIGNVILAKRDRDLRIRRRLFRSYSTQLNLNTPAGPFAVRRSWVGVDATFHGKRLRFVDTHLESEIPTIRATQAQELAARGGPLTVGGQKVLVGDLNSDPSGRSGEDPAAYRTIRRGLRFRDAFIQDGAEGNGFTAGEGNALLRAPRVTWNERIDYVFFRPRTRISKFEVLGGKRSDRASGGLWPSDHGGVAATFRFL